MAGITSPGCLRLGVVLHEGHRLGSGVAMARLIPRFRSMGWTVSVWLAGSGALEDEVAAVANDCAVVPRPFRLSAPWQRPDGEGRVGVRELLAYQRAFRDWLLEAQPHVLHANTLLTIPEASLARFRGLPVVLYVHELVDADHRGRIARAWAGRVATSVATVSADTAAPFRPLDVEVIENGVPAVRERGFSAPSDQLVVGTVGSVSHRKGTDLFVEVANRVADRLPGVVFEHLGPSGVEKDPGFEQHVVEATQAAARLGTDIRFLGPGDTETALRRWDAFAFPTRSDPFPLAVLEAMAAGLPIVAMEVGGVPTQLAHGRAGVLVSPGDTRAMADRLVDLLTDEGKRQELGRAARERAMQHFGLDAQARRLHDLYLRAIASRYAPAFNRFRS